MKTKFVRAAVVACLLGSAGIVVGFLPIAAAAADKPAATPAPPAPPAVSKDVGKLLDAARKLMIAGDYTTAKATVLQARDVPNRTPIDDFEINNFLGNIAIKLNDHATAEVAFSAMADSPDIPDTERAATFRIATLLSTEQKHFDKGIKYGKAFVALGGPPDDTVLASMSEAYYYMKDYAAAETAGKQAIAAAPAGKAPNENALTVVFGAEIQLKKQDDAVKTLEQMVDYYGKPDDWGQLVRSAFGIPGIKQLDDLNLFRLELATKASIEPADYDTIAQLAIQMGYPVEAQAALEAGISAGKVTNSGKTAATLANARTRAAKDRATLSSFEATAAKSPNGELDIKLAQTYFGYGRYADAVTAARRGLGKGGAKADANEANMVIGMALAMQGNSADAQAALNNVKGSPATTRVAHLWSLYAGRKSATAAAPAH
jgi:tetratricopeptide (TPR) repeat protein